MEAKKKRLPKPLTSLGHDNVRQGCWVAGVTHNLGCLASGSVPPLRVHVGLGASGPWGVRSAGCLALGFLAGWNVEAVEV